MPGNFQKNLMRTPKSVDVAITARCNLRCKHCSHFNSEGDTGKDLSTNEWVKFFEELGRLAVMEICLQGGEPFFRDDIKEIIQHIVSNRMRFSVLSNGTLIDDDMAAFLAKTGRCNSVQVSIDGSNPAVHDALRGKGAFVKAVEGLCNLKKNKVNVTVRVTVNKYNTGDLGNIAKFLLGELGLASFSTNSASYMGLCRQFSEEIQLTVDEHSKAMAELVRLDQTYNGRISAMAGPLANAWTWLQMDMARKKGLKDVPGCGYLTSCGGILNKLAVRSDGAILPCLLMPHIELGWINTDNLLKIWEGHPELKRLRQRVSVPLSNFDFCNGCEYVNYCRGNCPALAHTILGNDFHPSPDSCLRLFLKQGGKLPEEVLRSTDRMQ